MSYINITFATVARCESYVDTNYIDNPNASSLKKYVLGRVLYLSLSPLSFFSCALDIIIGLGAWLGSVSTFGLNDRIFEITKNHLFASKALLANSYLYFLYVINPNARCGLQVEGLVSSLVSKPLEKIAQKCCGSKSFIKRQFLSRLTYGLMAVTLVFSRVMDGLIGLPLAGLSLLTLGKIKFLNDCAFRALQAPGVIYDLFYCTAKIVNPWEKRFLKPQQTIEI